MIVVGCYDSDFEQVSIVLGTIVVQLKGHSTFIAHSSQSLTGGALSISVLGLFTSVQRADFLEAVEKVFSTYAFGPRVVHVSFWSMDSTQILNGNS